MHGEHPSRQTFPNGSFYEGQFILGKREGRGAWMDVNTRGTTYLGSWVANQMHGQGILEMNDGYMYNGTFVYGACTGQAKIRYSVAQGDSVSEPATYEGEMVNGARQGTGTYRQPYLNGIRGAWWEYSGCGRTTRWSGNCYNESTWSKTQMIGRSALSSGNPRVMCLKMRTLKRTEAK